MKPDRKEAIYRAAMQAATTLEAAMEEAKRRRYWDRTHYLSRKAERAARRLAALSRWFSDNPE